MSLTMMVILRIKLFALEEFKLLSRTFSFTFFSAWLIAFTTSLVGQDDATETTEFFRATAFQDVEIAAQEPGIVRKLFIKEGSSVKPGEDLIGLNRRLFELEASRARTEKKIAELEETSDADLQFAKKSTSYNLIRLERLKQANEIFAKSVSQSEKDQAELEWEKSRLSIEQATLLQNIASEKSISKQKDLDIAERRLQLRTIQSTLAGTIVELKVDEGEWVQSGQAIARIVNYRRLKVKGYVSADQFSVADVGKKLRFLAIKPRVEGDPVLEATITFVSPEIEPKFFSTPKVRIVAELDNKDLKIRINTELRLAR